MKHSIIFAKANVFRANKRLGEYVLDLEKKFC